MSDEEYEYEYEYGSDNDPYDYGSGGEDQDEVGIEIENAFYDADDRKQENPEASLASFERVVKLETEKGGEVKWRFKALENIVQLSLRLNNYEKAVDSYKQLLSYMDQVTRNEANDCINNVLDMISSSTASETVEKIYELTLNALKTSNERLWFNTCVKLCKLYIDRQDVANLTKMIRELYKHCQNADGSVDASKNSHMLEVYALEIQLCTITKNSKRMKEIYPKTTALTAVIADPRIMGVIRESGGKMYMSEKRWELAYNEFFEAFRNYQETGNPRSKACLKYVVLANMLALSKIDPFDSREAKVFQSDQEILAMKNLRDAYDRDEILEIEKIINDKRNKILEDPFMKIFIDDLLRNIRRQVLKSLTRPYKTVSLQFLAQELRIPVEQVESLLVELILDSEIDGKVDQVKGHLDLYDKSNVNTKKFSSLLRWSNTLEHLNSGMFQRLASHV